MAIRTGTAAMTGISITRKCFIFTPLRKSIATIRSPIHMVMDIFGSKMTSRHMPPPAARTGSIPTNFFMRSGFSLAYAAAKMTKPYFAISDGCIVIGPSPIQRVAP